MAKMPDSFCNGSVLTCDTDTHRVSHVLHVFARRPGLHQEVIAALSVRCVRGLHYVQEVISLLTSESDFIQPP